MRITLGELRSIIRRSITEIGGARSTRPSPVTLDPTAPGNVTRQQLSRISVRDMDPSDEIAPHLRDDYATFEQDFGPVPPDEPNPYVTLDPYVNDFNVLPTPQIKR